MSDIGDLVNANALRSFIERIERVEQTIRDEQEARKEIYAEAKGAGFDPKIMRKIVSLRRHDKAKREEFETLLDLYLSALGDLKETPLGRAAVSREFGASAPQ